jgi:hypothetical protein
LTEFLEVRSDFIQRNDCARQSEATQAVVKTCFKVER